MFILLCPPQSHRGRYPNRLQGFMELYLSDGDIDDLVLSPGKLR